MYTAINNNGIKIRAKEAIRGYEYFCPVCKTGLVFKSGKYNSPHFAHINNETCDTWKNEMSLWHNLWQDLFSIDSIEIPITIDEKTHIADVLIDNKVVEFQHSNISYDEIQERNNFYLKYTNKLIWVFDGIGKKFYMKAIPHDRYINRINIYTELDCSKEKEYYWKNQNKVIKDIKWNDGLELYIQVNENYLIKVTKMLSDQFNGIAIKIEDFLKTLSNDIGYNGEFNGYSEYYRREEDIKRFKKQIREIGKKNNKETNIQLDLYLNKKMDYNEIRKYLNETYNSNFERSSYHSDYYQNGNTRKNNNYDFVYNTPHYYGMKK